MAYAGQIIHNPVSGERIEFLHIAAARRAAGQVLQRRRRPGPRPRPGHPRAGHGGPVHDDRRAGREGKVLRSGMPTPTHLALFVQRFRREVRAPFPPAPIVHAVMAPLASLARRRGHAARYAPAIA